VVFPSFWTPFQLICDFSLIQEKKKRKKQKKTKQKKTKQKKTKKLTQPEHILQNG
jgi:hypothetical protein